MKCFISHIGEEGRLASALKAIIEKHVPGAQAWVSGDDIGSGQQWFESLEQAIDTADAVVVLCSAASLRRPWINFEAGAGWGRNARVVPVCHTDLTIAELPFPLSVVQGHNLYTRADLVRFLAGLAGPDVALDDDWAIIQDAIASIDYAPPAVRPLPQPASPQSILLDGSHGQLDWPQQRRGTLFDLARTGFERLIGVPGGEVALVDSADQIRAADLSGWRGLILAMPWRAHLERRAIEQIVGWVRDGGRLVLLGFELGDLHHAGNLNDLAAEFGLRFNGDIVAPAGWERGKPYGVDIRFEADVASGILEGVESVVWRNVQTLAFELGTRPLLQVGTNALAVPTPDSVGFAGGSLTMPSPEFRIIDHANWLPVLAAATPHLTGAGDVLGCGTWDLLPDGAAGGDNERFVGNLLGWLVGRSS